MWVKWKLASVCLVMVLISAQDSCTVCAECTTGMEIFLAAPEGPLGEVGQMEARFDSFEDCANLDARWVYVDSRYAHEGI
jgi:hypothetical protein